MSVFLSTEDFIKELAKYVAKYGPEYNRYAFSAIIAQGILESAKGTSNKVYFNGEWRHNYFGLKWRDNRCQISNDYFEEKTSEQNKDGSYTTITSKFCKFKSLEECVIGYFQWTNISNYKNLQGVTDPETYLKNIKEDKYATSIDYVQKCMNVIKTYNLTQYDKIENKEEENPMKIAIDAGHGSQTAGKRTPDGYLEHWINVKCAYYCEKLLNANGIKTLRVGWDDTNAKDDPDVALSTRQKQIKNAGCDYSVSFHANAYGSGWNSANGVETIVHSNANYRKDSINFANKIQAQLIKGTPQTNRKVKMQVLAMCNCVTMSVKAAALVEVGFMTNEHEAELMKTDAFCKEQGEDVARGIMDYVGVKAATTTVNESAPAQPATKPSSSTSTSTKKKNIFVQAKNTTLKATATKLGVQKYLNAHYGDAIKSVLGKTLDTDGIAGANTKKGMCIAIQTELNAYGAGLDVDGLFGSASEAKWNSIFGTIKNGSRGIAVTLWQCVLVIYGYNPNGIDGICGNGCINATNSLFKAKGITRDSNVTGSDVNKLF